MGSSARDLVLFSSRSLGTIADTPATIYMRPAPNILPTAPGRYARCLTCALILLFSVQAGGQSADKTKILQQLTEERLMLMAELDQFQNTLRILQSDDTPPEESTNPAIRSLAVQVVKLKEQLIAVTEQEVTLLQQQIIAAKLKTDTNRVQKIDTTVALAKIETRPDDSIEGVRFSMARFQTESLPQEKFLLVAVNLLRKTFVDASRTEAKKGVPADFSWRHCPPDHSGVRGCIHCAFQCLTGTQRISGQTQLQRVSVQSGYPDSQYFTGTARREGVKGL